MRLFSCPAKEKNSQLFIVVIIKQYLRRFQEQLRIGLLPFLQSSLRCFGILNGVHHKLSKNCCISVLFLHITVSPDRDSLRALLMERRIAGVMLFAASCSISDVSSLWNTQPIERAICSNQPTCALGTCNVSVAISVIN